MQESYREGGRVRTRTIEYLGAVEPAVAQQVRATREQLGQADMAALVTSVRAASTNIIGTATSTPQIQTEASAPLEAKPLEQEPRPKSVDATNRPEPMDIKSSKQSAPSKSNFITTGTLTPTLRPFAKALKFPSTLKDHSVSETSLQKTHARFGERLKAMQINPAAMPDVEIKYGHPDGMRRNRDGSYTVTASRKSQNKRHQINKTKLWEHTRQAMSLAYLDALADERPELHHQLQSQLDASHQSTKRLLVNALARAATPTERLALSLQLYFWSSVPQKLTKTLQAEEFGQASFTTLKDWRAEAAHLLSTAHKSGWDGVVQNNKKARRKLKSTITKHRTTFDRMGLLDRLSAQLSGKRRKLIREMMAAEEKLRAVDQLDMRINLLRKHFPL